MPSAVVRVRAYFRKLELALNAARKERRPAEERTAIKSGVRFAQDPDAGTRRVWAFKSGHSFHSRGCHLVQARDGAVRIPLSTAKTRGLERCMHCAPTVR